LCINVGMDAVHQRHPGGIMQGKAARYSLEQVRSPPHSELPFDSKLRR
jgi:hypothetical protein